MKDEQRFAQLCNSIAQSLLGNVVEEGAANSKWTTGERDFYFAAGADLVEVILQQAGNVGGIAGRADGHHRTRLRHLGSRSQHGRAAETVADENCRRSPNAAKLVCGGNEISDVGGKRRIGEFAFARAKSGEVEAEHGNANRGQAFGDPPGCVNIFAAREAMGEQSVGPRWSSRLIKERGETVSFVVGEVESLSRHAKLQTPIARRLAVSLSAPGEPRSRHQPYLNQFLPYCD
jgi:hypothetical protein